MFIKTFLPVYCKIIDDVTNEPVIILEFSNKISLHIEPLEPKC